MLLKYKFSQHRPHYYGGSGYGGPGFGGGGGGGGQPGYPIAGTVPGSTSSSSGATSSAAGNSFELRYEDPNLSSLENWKTHIYTHKKKP